MSEWISVNDGLPQPDSEVLCLDFTRGDYFNAEHCRQSGWYHGGVRVYVTHWMPLPEPPK